MCLQELRLVLRQSPHRPQFSTDYLPGPLLLRLSTWTLPNAHNRRTCSVNKPLHRLHQIILEASAAKLPVGEDVHANAALMLYSSQDGVILYVSQLFKW
jgi:hypothetical protein